MASEGGATWEKLPVARHQLVVSKKTALEESRVRGRTIRLNTFGDSLLKFRANDESYDREFSEPDYGETDIVTSCSEESFLTKCMDPTEAEQTSLIALAAIAQYRESGGEKTKQVLEVYVQQVFSHSKGKFADLYEQAKQSESPELKLMCTVVSGEDLEAKDANGLSDPYCRLGILSRQHQDSTAVKHKNLVDWEREGLVKEVVTTSVQPATLNPTWNESFEFSVTDPKDTLLVVEAWDSDENRVSPTKIKGFKGLGIFLSDHLKKSDDFLGRAFYLLQTIPVQGEERSLTLFSHSAKHHQGKVKLRLSIRGLREDVPVDVALKEYLMLLKAVVSFDSRKDGQHQRRWDAELSDKAEKLLLLQATLNDLNKLQTAACRLSVLLEYHKVYAVEMEAFCVLFQRIKENRRLLEEKSAVASPEECALPTQEQWITQLFGDFQELASYILDVMRNHLLIFNLKSPQGIERIRKHVATLRELYSFRPFVEKLAPGQRYFRESLELSIQAAVPRWFLVLSGKSMPLVNTEEEQLDAFRGLCTHCLYTAQRVFAHLVPIFKEVDVEYFTNFFVALDRLLHSEAVSRLENYGAENSSGTFDIYLTFRDIKELAQHVDESARGQLKIMEYHKWFRPMVIGWIRTAGQKCRVKLTKAIEVDEIVLVTNEAKFSSSAVDAKAILLQFSGFWSNLAWPVAADNYGYTITIMQNICESALYYVDQVYGSLQRKDFYDEGGDGDHEQTRKSSLTETLSKAFQLGSHTEESMKFRATEKLCIVLNNMHHVRMALQDLPKKMELEKFYHWLEEEQKRDATSKEGLQTQGQVENLAEKADQVIGSLFSSADEDIGNKISNITCQISRRLSPDIEQFIQQMMLARSESTLEEAIAPLLDYFTSNLQTLGDYLLSPIFWLILQSLWGVTVETLKKTVERVPHRENVIYLYKRLGHALKMSRDFYHADGNGLSDEVLDSKDYKSLLSDLEVLMLPTKELWLKFQADLARQQAVAAEKGEKKLGTLLFSVGYLKSKEAVEVTVVQGQKLPALDLNGLSDPFVILRLWPEWLFSKSSEKNYKTSVRKKTVNPVFNEEFLLPAKEASLDKEGAVLILAVYDYDKISANDYAGICVVSCREIPRLASTKSSIVDATGPERKNFMLPLIHIRGSLPLRELEARQTASDPDACSFSKSYKDFLSDVPRKR